jgi:hypothetical protein
MNRITTAGVLPGGPEFVAVVTPGHIVIRAGDKVCAAHNRWFGLDEARGLLQSLALALQPPQTVCTCPNGDDVTAAMRTETGQHLAGCPQSSQPLHAPQPESDIPT